MPDARIGQTLIRMYDAADLQSTPKYKGPVYHIYLSIQNGQWIARNTDPAVEAVFGTALVPTAFTEAADREQVRQYIQAANPHYIVEFEAVN